MAKYLDSKADLTFKKVFGEHPNLVASLLNSLLPLADFKDRALFNSAKVYVDQLEHAEDFSLLRPVYSLNLVDAVFEKDVPEFIHHYKVVHEKYTDKLIEGFHTGLTVEEVVSS